MTMTYISIAYLSRNVFSTSLTSMKSDYILLPVSRSDPGYFCGGWPTFLFILHQSQALVPYSSIKTSKLVGSRTVQLARKENGSYH